MATIKREINLIATFEDGYTLDWKYKLKECFRSDLDIKYSERFKNKISRFEWTQGPYYSFSEGDIFFDNVLCYKKWSEALNSSFNVCQINKAKPRVLTQEGTISDGVIEFTVYKNEVASSKLTEVGMYTSTQVSFVSYLKTGILP